MMDFSSTIPPVRSVHKQPSFNQKQVIPLISQWICKFLSYCICPEIIFFYVSYLSSFLQVFYGIHKEK